MSQLAHYNLSYGTPYAWIDILTRCIGVITACLHLCFCVYTCNAHWLNECASKTNFRWLQAEFLKDFSKAFSTFVTTPPPILQRTVPFHKRLLFFISAGKGQLTSNLSPLPHDLTSFLHALPSSIQVFPHHQLKIQNNRNLYSLSI